MIDPLIESGNLHPLSLNELFALALPEVEHLVDGILPRGSLILLSARPKAGKGLLTLDLSASVAFGETFLGRDVQQGLAIYAGAEEHPRDIRNRLHERLQDRRDGPLMYLPLDGSMGTRLWLHDAAGMQQLTDIIRELKPVLLVLDPLRELHDGREDMSDDMAPIMRPLRQLAHEFNTTIVLNHHLSKNGTPRGSTAITGAVDGTWLFDRDDSDPADDAISGSLTVEGRHGPRVAMRIELGEQLRFEVAGAAQARALHSHERILEYLGNQTYHQTAREIAEGAGVADKTVQNLLPEWISKFPLRLDIIGSGTRSDPKRYALRRPTGFETDPSLQLEMIPPDPAT